MTPITQNLMPGCTGRPMTYRIDGEMRGMQRPGKEG